MLASKDLSGFGMAEYQGISKLDFITKIVKLLIMRVILQL